MKQINLLEASLGAAVPPHALRACDALMMAVPQWEGVHPLLKILPVEWDYSIPFGLLHLPTPSPAVRELIRTVVQVMGAPA